MKAKSFQHSLRTVPPFVTAHTFCCASRVWSRIFEFLRNLPSKGILVRFVTMWKKQFSARAIRIHKKKLGVTAHFSEINELRFGKKMPHILCILNTFFVS